MTDLQLKSNGLSSQTKFDEFNYPNSSVKQEWHEHPVTGELVIMDTWFVPDGECVSQESEVIKTFPMIGCEIAKMNVGYHNQLFIA